MAQTPRVRLLVATGIVLSLVSSAAALIQPLLLGGLLDAVIDKNSLRNPILLLIGLFVLDAASSALQAYVLGVAGEDIVRKLRVDVFSRVMRSKMVEFHKLDHGDVQTRIVADSSLARVALADSVASVASNSVMVIGCLGFMLYLDLTLFAATLCCLGVAAVISLALAARVRTASKQNREDTSVLGSAIQRVLSSIVTVKASRAEDREEAEFAASSARARRSGLRVTALSSLFGPSMSVGTQAALAVVIGLGMSRVASGSMTIADFTSFLMYLFYIISPLLMVFISIGEWQQGRAAVDRLSEFLDIPQEEVGAGRQERLPEHTAQDHDAVQFREVSFSYSGDGTPSLDRASFAVPPRGLTALIGPSGAGKSTVFALIEGLFRAERGRVCLWGVPVEELELSELRGAIGYVEQNPQLQRGTIRENVVYARPDAGDEEIMEALRLVNLVDVVRLLPEGLDTQLTQSGLGLSGGEKQRLAIARAILQRPRLLLLDEATSNLDTASEDHLRDTLDRVSRDYPVVAIAHRMTTVEDADHVILLETGRVRAEGRHEELRSTDELYAKLSRSELVP